MQGQTTVAHIAGERNWTLTIKEEHREFRAESHELAACWVATLRRRVCSWSDLLKGQDAEDGMQLGGVTKSGGRLGQFRLAQLENAREIVGVLGTTAEIMKELGSVPVAGPALSLLGFSLEIVRREQAELESLQSARSRLLQITKRTVQAMRRAFQCDDQDYTEELLDFLKVIEEGARELEGYEHRSKAQRLAHAILNRKTGPTGILQLIEHCEDQLSKLEIHHTAEGFDKLSAQVECMAQGVDEGKGRTLLSRHMPPPTAL